LSKSSSTVNGHLNQKSINARSTKIKEETNNVTTEGDLDYGIKTNCIYAATIDAEKSILTKLGAFLSFTGKEINKSWSYMSMMAIIYWQNQ
jgi:hypothetical protein